MKVLRGDIEITTNTLTELFKIHSSNLEGEIRSKLFNTDEECPSYKKVQGIVDTLVVLEEYMALYIR